MTDIGEAVSVAAATLPDKAGTLKIKVVDECKGEPIEAASIAFRGAQPTSDANGYVELSDLAAGSYSFAAEKHFEEADHIRFILHYPKIGMSKKALSIGAGTGDVTAGGTTETTVKLPRFRLVQKIVFKRREIDIGGSDKYGHWWTEFDDAESYGWWPKYPIGHPNNASGIKPEAPVAPEAGAGIAARIQHFADTAAYTAQKALYSLRDHSLVRTMRGVEGELNGQTSFGGNATQDPHALMGDEGDSRYQPVLADCRSDAECKQAVRTFKDGFRQRTKTWNWAFESGNHCHSFQIEMIRVCGFEMFKEV